MIVYLLISIVLIGFIAGIAQSVRNHSRLNREATEQDLYGSSERSDHHSFFRSSPSRPTVHQCDAFGVRFALTADRRTAYLLYSPKQPILTVPASKSTESRIIREGHSLSLVGAADGGLIAGDEGAVLCAASGAYIPLRYSLVIYLDDAARLSVEYAPAGSHFAKESACISSI